MKSILQNIFLFFTILLFGWGYGQVCVSTDIQNIASQDTYPGINATLNSLTPSGSGNSAAIAGTITNLIDNDLDSYYSLQSSLPTVSANGSLNASFSINNLDIKKDELVNIKIDELNVLGGSSGVTEASVSYSITAYNENGSFSIPLTEEFDLNIIDNSNKGIIFFTAIDNIDRLTIQVNATKQFNVATSLIGQSRLNLRFYGLYVNPLCLPRPTLTCNENTYIKNPDFMAEFVDSRTTSSNVNFINRENLIDNNESNSASIGSLTGLVDLEVSIRNKNGSFGDLSSIDTDRKKHFVGYEIKNSGLLNLNLGGGALELILYNNNVEVDRSNSNNSLLSLSLLNVSDKYIFGMTTDKQFDEIQLKIKSGLGLNLSATELYGVIVKELCSGGELDCNDLTFLRSPEHPVSIESQRSGTSSDLNINIGSLGTIPNLNYVVDEDPDNYATISGIGVNSSAAISVKNGIDIYGDDPTNPDNVIPHFAGFEISSNVLLNANIGGKIVIKTYLDGVLQEQSTNDNISILGLQALGSSDRSNIGFITSKKFNEIQYYTTSLIGVEASATKIYSAVVRKLCEGPQLVCNTLTNMKSDNYPVAAYYKNSALANLSISGEVVEDISNLLDNDLTNAVTINNQVQGLGSVTIGVNRAINPFKKGSYIEFEIEKISILDLSILENISINLWKKNDNGVFPNNPQATISGNQLLVDLGNILTNSVIQTQKIGIKAPIDFDRVELVFKSEIIGVKVGQIKIYRFNVMETCPIDLDCNDSDPITNVDRPVIINQINTGTSGIACVGCSINNPDNLIDNDLSNSTSLVVGVGVAARNAISVKDLANVYPAGSSVGFATADLNTILNLDLLNTIQVNTYLNGQLVESKSGASLINLNALFIQIFPQNAVYGFRTTSKFDEVQISLGSLVSAINVINLRSLVISTQGANDSTLNFECTSENCVKPGNTNGPGLPTLTGITTLQNPRNTWPNDIPNGFIALESKNKGMVISRVANTNAIATPLEGMLIYDVSANCVKLYNGTVWKCLEQSCNE